MLSVDQVLRLISVPAVIVAFLIASQVSGAGVFIRWVWCRLCIGAAAWPCVAGPGIGGCGPSLFLRVSDPVIWLIRF